MTFEEKFATIRKFYEEKYKIKLKSALAISEVEWLFSQMCKLTENLNQYDRDLVRKAEMARK